MDKKTKEIQNTDVVERQKPMYAATVEDGLLATGTLTTLYKAFHHKHNN